MKNETELPPVTDNELLARFVLFSNWIRYDKTVRPDAFIPYPNPYLSVTRHRELSEADLWKIGQSVADKRSHNLYGRADIQAHPYTLSQHLCQRTMQISSAGR